ncbi:MAG: CapA family protein [Firmicutes bacterium]|nr:CapA family protein [Bacillota bacterium]
MNLKKNLKKILHKTQGEPLRRSGEAIVILAGNVGGASFGGVKQVVQPADLAVCALKPTLADREKTTEAARKAGFDFLWGETPKENRPYQICSAKGIGIGLISFDAADQKVKDLKENIAEARSAGADFVIAYMNCNGKDEAAIAKRIANAGADYIFGYGRKKNGPYTVILSADGRRVPALYSCNGLMRNNGETILLELKLKKDRKGSVIICQEGYHPCVTAGKISMMQSALKTEDMDQRLGLEETLLRLKMGIGVQKRLQCYAGEETMLQQIAEGNRSAAQRRYEVKPPLTAKKKQTDRGSDDNGYRFAEDEKIYRRLHDTAEREAVLVCTGHLEYGGQLEKDAESFGEYTFLKSFRRAVECFEGADFVAGGFATMASDQYPGMGEVSLKARKEGYNNCRREFVTALHKAGFTGLAAANDHNACMGIEGIFDTERSIAENAMISSGLGNRKNPVIEINGIRIGFLSVTTECIHKETILTEEAASRFLNCFDPRETKREIRRMKAKGAEFILAYLHCGMNQRLSGLEERKNMAQKLAELGADYVICTGSRVVTPYYGYETSDGRRVPVATSLGCFLTGRREESGLDSAVLKLAIRKDFDGSIYVEDRYMPVKIFDQYEGVQHAIVPVKENSIVADALGQDIRQGGSRVIGVNDIYTKTLTIAEIYDILGKQPCERDLERLGDRFDKPVSSVAVRKRYMRENGVAVMYKFGDFGGLHPIEWDIERCVEAGVSLVIDNEPHDELPCIVVDEPLMDVFEKLSKAVRDWYHPVTVAITGSMGKTTAKELTTKVFETNFKTLCAKGNNNAIYQIGNLLQSMEEDDEAYIQEVHGGTLGTAACVSRVISPDICIVTNIVKNHISQIGSVENLIANKLAITEGMKPDGVLILCDDNEYLREAEPAVRTIRYSIENKDAHYYAQNIVEAGESVRFEIVSRDSEFDTAGVYPAVLHTRGIHNVSNALAAFAAGRQAGIPPYKIIAGLSRYRTTGIRQNAFVHNGIHMVLDTYNSNPKALMAMFDVIDQMEPAEGGRKILVLGMMGEQGEDSPKIHYDTGKAICAHPFDILFCYGEDAKHMAAAVRECGREAYYFEDREVFNRAIADTVRPGDVVLVKGSHSMELDGETMVPIFGRAIRQY